MAAAKDSDSGARKTTSGSRRTSAPRTSEGSRRSSEVENGRGSSEKPRPHRRVSAPKAMRYAAGQLSQLLGREPESVSALKPTEDGWEADVEVVELERIPETTSVMASYRVTLDEDGELVGYERLRRYTRGQIDRRM